MLKITNDGRKLALDQRMIDPMLPDDPDSKVNACVDNVYRIWEEYAGKATISLCPATCPPRKMTVLSMSTTRYEGEADSPWHPGWADTFYSGTDAQKKELFGESEAAKSVCCSALPEDGSRYECAGS